MLSLYEILKASKTGIAPDMWTALAGKNWGGADSGHEIKELTGIPPLSFTADGTPLLDYIISGNMSQNGTPTPDNPIMPNGTGERTGNLFDAGTVTPDYYVNDENENISKNENYNVNASDYININGLSSIYLSTHGVAGARQWAAFYDNAKTYISGFNGYNRAVSVPNNATYLRVTVHDTYLNNFSVVSGNTAPMTYEPYGYKIPISSANTTTPVYLGEVETTRQIKKIVFVGSEDENWSSQPAGGGAIRFRYTISNSVQADTAHLTSICTHLTLGVEGGTWNTDNIYTISNNYLLVRLDSSFTTVVSLKSWLAQQYANGTPFTVYYTLTTPETAVVNEPLRKIGDYADTLSMEQAGVQIPTNRGNTVIDVETTLKPSQMYIKYQE